MKDLKFKLSFDERGRVIYQPGDIVGVVGKGIIPWLSYHAIVPSTDLFHFLLIRDRIGTEDYEILEMRKGVAVGRLSWYQSRQYIVFRVNHENAAEMGKLAVNLASKFGRHKYDWKLYVRIFAWALGYWLKEIFTGHIPPRPVYPTRIPYETDQDFICIELVFEAWKQVGFRIREHGHAPVPAEIILARDRGDLEVIDSHDGNPANWRTLKSTLYTAAQGIVERHIPKPMSTVAEAMEKVGEGDTVTVNGGEVTISKRPKPGPDLIGRQGGQKRNRAHIYRQPYGYPIRLCDWVAVDVETIERIGEAQGLNGPAQKEALVMALDWAEATKGAVICKHCRAAVKGKRGPLMGEPGGYA